MAAKICVNRTLGVGLVASTVQLKCCERYNRNYIIATFDLSTCERVFWCSLPLGLTLEGYRADDQWLIEKPAVKCTNNSLQWPSGRSNVDDPRHLYLPQTRPATIPNPDAPPLSPAFRLILQTPDLGTSYRETIFLAFGLCSPLNSQLISRNSLHALFIPRILS
ncbi:hypothetical protein DER45DRAFT_225395 [Fusarium avenaceum]|nr:hypothetical protein DER45DRAFT_225395 [Fusarium avenaceum]